MPHTHTHTHIHTHPNSEGWWGRVRGVVVRRERDGRKAGRQEVKKEAL